VLLLLLSRASRKRTKDEGRNCLTKEEEEEEEEDVFNPALPPCVPKVNPVVVLIDNRRLIFVCFCFLFVFCGGKSKKEFVRPFCTHNPNNFPLQKKSNKQQVSSDKTCTHHTFYVFFEKMATTRIRL
tara:strand:- start:4421 stop:4801 length:381 start_codon:yes stop_codon:yes gene_type:complete